MLSLAITLFASIVIAYAVALTWSGSATGAVEPSRQGGPLPKVAFALLLTVTAVLVYRPVVQIGLLADDFTLLQWARSVTFLPRSWEYARPLPLIAWWALASVVPGPLIPTALHVLGVLVHAMNAWLVWRLADRLGVSRLACMVASVLFLLSPIAVEPVTWCSGVFDLLLTTFALTLCLVSTRRPHLRFGEQVACIVVGILMIVAKETGVIAAPLVVLVCWTRWGAVHRSTSIVAAGLALLALVYAALRAFTGRLDPRLTPVFDLDSVRRLFTQSFAALTVPLHEVVIRSHPVVAVVVPGVLIVLVLMWTRRWRHSPRAARLAILAAVSLVVSVVPVIRPFGVLGNLQGSRYVYLPAAFWSIALASALLDGWASRAMRVVGASVAALAIACATIAVRTHLGPWLEARRVRDAVLVRLASIPSFCVRVHAEGVPDNVAGAYVFRNGLSEAVAAQGRNYEFVAPENAPPECRVDLSGTVEP